MRGRRHGQRHHHRAPRLALEVFLKLVVGLLVAWVILRIGIGILRAFSEGTPDPPPAGELRKVNLRYRCSVCGVELRLTAAPDEDPPPPRHCQEDMDLVAPLFD